MSKEIVICSQYLYPENCTTSNLLTAIGSGLHKRQWSVTGLAAPLSYHGRRKVPRRVEVPGGWWVRRVPSTALHRRSALGRIVNTLTLSASMMLAALLSRRRVGWLVVTNPPVLPWVALVRRRLTGGPFILLVHDIYPQSAEVTGHLKAGGWLSRLWNRLNRAVCRRADGVIVLGRDMERRMVEILGDRPPRRMTIIPNWSNIEDLDHVLRDPNPFRAQWSPGPDDVVFLYQGNLGYTADAETLVAACRAVAGDPVHFAFFAAGHKLEEAKRALADCPRCHFMEYVPQEKMGQVLGSSDVGIVSLAEGATGYSVPSKLYPLLAAGLPILGVVSAESEVARVVEEERCGSCVRPGDGDGLVAAVRRFRAEPQWRREMGRNARRAYVEKYTYDKAMKAYDRFCSEVFRGAPHDESVSSSLAHPDSVHRNIIKGPK